MSHSTGVNIMFAFIIITAALVTILAAAAIAFG
jgi:hypothetical protein